MKQTYTSVVRHILPLLYLFSLGWQQTQAQVKIGTSNENINQGASLEVESGPYPGNVYRGLLFPRVALTDYGTWSLTGTPTDGMVVFNTATTTGTYPVTPGIYCWYNNQWNRQSPETVTKVAQIASVDCLPGVPATGPFDAGLNLTASYPYLKQTKQITVVPATSGTYSINTNFANDDVNTYRFVASGTFTPDQVGVPQTINLQPNGLVENTVSGTDSFTVSAIFSTNPYSSTSYCPFTVTTTNSTDCGGPLLGTYKVGTPFDDSNIKQITFTPPYAGAYTFSAGITYSIYGNANFAFSKSVTFTADQVGKPQPVTLVANSASGAPVASGSFRPYLNIAGPDYFYTTIGVKGIGYTSVCQFDVTVAP